MPWSYAIGSTVPRDMKIPGRELKGIHFAMEFLPDATRRVYGVKPVNDITAEGKHVVIIGGGDTGSDCLGTSIRQGAKDVTVLQIMPQEPSERPANQPWPTFARLYQKTSSMEEGGEYIYSTDSVNFEGTEEEKAKVTIDNSTTAEGFVADERGHVTGLKVVSVAPGENWSVHSPAWHRARAARRSGPHLRGLPASGHRDHPRPAARRTRQAWQHRSQ